MILNRDIEDKENYADDEEYDKIGVKDEEKDDEEKDNEEKVEEEQEEQEEEKEHYYKKEKKSPQKGLLQLSQEKIIYIEIFAIIIISFVIIILLKKIFFNKSDKNEEIYLNQNQNISQGLNETNITNNTNNTNLSEKIKIINEIEPKINEEEENLNKIKNALINIYEKNGQINIVQFYEEYINQKNYTLPQYDQYDNIHINIGFNDDILDSIIIHITSILYRAEPKSFIHIHMMNSGNFSYDSMIKLKKMIYKVNNLTEIIVYNARQILKDFLIRVDSISKFSYEYAKLYAFKIIKNVPKIIFMDGDDCIVQKDLKELYSLNMDNIYARGITDEPSIRYSMNWMDKYLYDRTHYINGGVMLINLELCQNEDIYDRAIKLNNDIFYTKTDEPAQDIINVLLRKKIEFFHPKFNKINYYEKEEDKNDETKWYWWIDQTLKIGSRNNHFYTKEDLIEADKNPVIIHYAWDRYLLKTIDKYEKDKQFYANLTEINC